MLYVIILIQILIRYNVKILITECTRSLDFDLKIEKSPYPGTPPSQTLPPLGRFAPSHLSTFPLGAPQCVDPRYATVYFYKAGQVIQSVGSASHSSNLEIVSWEPEGRWDRCTKLYGDSAVYWVLTGHRWTSLAPFWFIYSQQNVN